MGIRYKLIAGISAFIVSVGGCFTHSVEYDPSIFGYYVITVAITGIAVIFGHCGDIDEYYK